MKYTHKNLEKFLEEHLGKEFPYKYKKLIIMMMDNFKKNNTSYLNMNMSKCIRELYGYGGKRSWTLCNSKKQREMEKEYSSLYTVVDRLSIYIRKIDDETIYRMFHYELEGDHITCKTFFLLLFERYNMK